MQCSITVIILSMIMGHVLCHVLKIPKGSKCYSSSNVSFMKDLILLYRSDCCIDIFEDGHAVFEFIVSKKS